MSQKQPLYSGTVAKIVYKQKKGVSRGTRLSPEEYPEGYRYHVRFDDPVINSNDTMSWPLSKKVYTHEELRY
jgi:hypothetical protein